MTVVKSCGRVVVVDDDDVGRCCVDEGHPWSARQPNRFAQSVDGKAGGSSLSLVDYDVGERRHRDRIAQQFDRRHTTRPRVACWGKAREAQGDPSVGAASG